MEEIASETPMPERMALLMSPSVKVPRNLPDFLVTKRHFSAVLSKVLMASRIESKGEMLIFFMVGKLASCTE